MKKEKIKLGEYIDNDELFNMLKSEDYDYVSFVMTKWHVHSFEAVLSYLNKKNKKKLKGIVLIIKSDNSEYIVNKEHILKDDGCTFYYINKKDFFNHCFDFIKAICVYCNLSHYKKRKDVFYLIRPNGFTYKTLGFFYRGIKRKKIVIVELDEGVGTYIQNNKTWLKSAKGEKNGILDYLRLYIKYFESIFLKKSKIIAQGLYIDGRLLVKDSNDEYIPNYDLLEYYREAIEKSSKDVIDVSVFTGRYVIINTQPNSHKYIDNIMACIDYITKKGYKVILKPHPRELNEYNFINNDNLVIYKELVSQEEILSVLDIKPQFIVGYYSTTLVTANVLYDVKTISLDDSVIERNSIDETEKQIMLKFKNTFKKYVKFYSNIEEIE